MFLAVVFVLGLIIGSFLNVVVLRLNTGESIIKSRSKCFSCGHRLGFFDLIPVLSFVFQKGRCRYCQSKISRHYPLVELITGIVFVLTALKIFNFQNLLSLIFYWAMFSILIAVSAYDFKHQIIPNKLVYLFVSLSLLFVILSFAVPMDIGTSLAPLGRGHSGLFLYLLSGTLFFAFFALMWLVSRGKWLGFGDAKLALGLGFLLGPWNSLAAFLFSFWLGGLVGIFLMALKKKRFNLKTQIPFAPFLVVGSFLAFLVGDKFISLLFGL